MKKLVLPEIVALGIYNAQVVFHNRSVSPNRKTTMFEIELPFGEGGISYIDETSHPISENVIICAKPGQIRHTRLPFKCYYIHMIVSEGQLFEALSSLPNYIEAPNTEEIRDIFLSLCDYYNTGVLEDDMMLQSLVMKLVYTLTRLSPARNMGHYPKQNNSRVIEQTLQYIGENLANPLSLDCLSKRANFSPIYFHKLFKASTGKTLREYVEEERIKKSVELLISTDMTLTEIAYECGFSSQSYFSYAFKKSKKMTPREYGKAIALKYEKGNGFKVK